jgi:membrane protein implicated in regulation of membrane protease activity
LAFVVLAIPVMWFLASAKIRLADQIGSRALRTDGIESIACRYLSAVIVLGLLAQLLFGAWWIDSATSLAIVVLLVKEGARRGKTNESRQQLLGRAALIHERPGFRPFHVAGFDGSDLEPRGADQVVHLAIEMTTSADPTPARRQPMLPAGNPSFRRQAVLDEKQLPARFDPTSAVSI